MHPLTVDLLAHLAAHRAVLRTAFDAVPPPLRERAPGPDRWSVAGVVEHLARTNHRLATLLQKGLRTAEAQTPLPPLAADTQAAATSLDPAAVLDRERRVAALVPLHPADGLDAGRAWHALERASELLHATVLAADGKDTRAVRAPHPAFGELDFVTWVRFVGWHEARHAAQIRATMAAAR
jgi:hypothetical protein